MVKHRYLGNYPSNDESDWSNQLQGVAHSDSHWHFTQRERIVKFHVSLDLRVARRQDAVAEIAMPSSLRRLGADHFGDPDYVYRDGRGYLFVPVEGAEGTPIGRSPVIVVFEDDGGGGPLTYIRRSRLDLQSKAGWCAISPLDGLLYSSNDELRQRNPLRGYEIDWDRIVNRSRGAFLVHRRDLPMLEQRREGRRRYVSFVETGSWVQGGTFAPDGSLYITSGRAASRIGRIRLFSAEGWLQQTSTQGGNRFRYQTGVGQEPEGITFWDLDDVTASHAAIRGQLHAILLNNQTDTDNIWFKHYRLDPVPRPAITTPGRMITTTIQRSDRQTGR